VSFNFFLWCTRSELKGVNIVKDISKLPPKRRRVLKYIIDNPDDVAISTSRDLAQKLGVNAATIVRSARDLGYSGYNELKKSKRDSFKQKQNPYEIVLKSMEKGENGSSIISKSFLKDIEVLNETVSNINIKDIENIAQLINDSKRVYIIGFESTARSIAGFLGGELRTYHPGILEIMSINVYLFDYIRHSKPGDLVIGISFGQGLKITVNALKYMKAKGVKTVAITDSKTSPLLEYADHKLVTAVSGEFVYSSMVSACSISNAIIHHLIKIGGEKSTDQLRELQKQMNELDVWF